MTESIRPESIRPESIPPEPVRRCKWCGRAIAPRPGPGRPPQYCRPSHRQRDFEARRRASELGRSEADLVAARDRIDAVLDHVYLLECAIADVERDLADDDSPEALRRGLAAVLEAARPLAAARLGP